MSEEDKQDCPKCLGAGEVLPTEGHFGTDMCPRCLGKGKLDWIEMVMGVDIYFAIPILRKYYPMLIAEEIAGVDPMGSLQVKIENKE
jgi:hypothetical protein